MAGPTLVIGDWHATCEPCGRGADPDEPTHLRVLGPERDEPDRPGCGVRWTHVRPDEDSMVGAAGRIRQMRPDLTLLAGDG